MQPLQGTEVAVFPEIAVTLVYSVLCLVPGFVSLQTATYLLEADVDLTEFEQATWSLVGSGIALSLLYFAYVVWAALATGDLVLVRPLELAWVQLVAGYPLLVGFAVLVGAGGAAVLDSLPASVQQLVTAR